MVNALSNFLSQSFLKIEAVVDSQLRVIFGKSERISDRLGAMVVLSGVSFIYGLILSVLVQAANADTFETFSTLKFQPEHAMILGAGYFLSPWLLMKILRFFRAQLGS